MRISSRDLAKKMEISHSTYMDWEHDKTSPSLKSYLKIAKALEVDPVELMAYLTGQTSQVVSNEEKKSVSELGEMVVYLRNHNHILLEDNQRIIAELERIQEVHT